MCNKSGAPAAFRGYRLQSLYIMHRILEGNKNLVYCPEKSEDLTIANMDTNEEVEDIQIKAHASNNLSLKDFNINKQEGFFRRILKYKGRENKPKVLIVSFDKVGPELLGAFKNKDDKHIKSIAKKLKEANFEQDDINFFFEIIKILECNEEDLKNKIQEKLVKSIFSCSVDTIFDNLNSWIYDCSEFKKSINQELLDKKILDIGKNSNAQLSYNENWFKIIQRLEDETELVNEKDFYQGSITKFCHINNNLDIKRCNWLEKINEKHNKHNIVIIHGASGQGKSTLAYRYMKDYFPSYRRFEIIEKGIENTEKVLEIAQCIKGVANNLKDYDIPIGFYIDIPPREIKWIELLKEIVGVKGIYILITIREEDWNRAEGETDNLTWEDLELIFSKEEAEDFYNRYMKELRNDKFLNFEESWTNFGGKGPLLEYAYFINSGITLRKKIKLQIEKIEKEKNTISLDILEMVSLASTYDSRISLKKLALFLGRYNKECLKYLENEYLIITNEQDKTVEGLHFVRSKIIVEILIDNYFTTWIDVAKRSLSNLYENDFKNFLNYVFYENNNTEEILEYIVQIQCLNLQTWVGVRSIIDSLVWLGVRDHIIENEEIIDESYKKYNSGWSFVSCFDVAETMPNSKEDPVINMFKIMYKPDEIKEKIKDIYSIRNKMTPSRRIFKYVHFWIKNIDYNDLKLVNIDQWCALGKVALILGKFQLDERFDVFIKNIDLNEILKIKYNSEQLSDVIVGLYYNIPDKIRVFCEENKRIILDIYRKDSNIIKIDEEEESLKIHKFFELQIDEFTKQQDNISYNNIAVKDLYILRKLMPYKKRFDSCGIGHTVIYKLLNLNIPDEMNKNIPIDNIPIEDLTKINSLYRVMATNKYRPADWKEFIGEHKLKQSLIVKYLRTIEILLIEYLKKEKYQYLYDLLIKNLNENGTYNNLNLEVLLPKTVLGKFDYYDESSSQSTSDIIKVSKNKPIIEKYKLLKDSLRKYYSGIKNFFDQYYKVFMNKVILNKNLGNLNKNILLDKLELIGYKDNLDWISIININDARTQLKIFSEEYENIFKNTAFYDEDFEKSMKETTLFIDKIIVLWASIVENWNVDYWNFSKAYKKENLNFKDNIINSIEQIMKKEKVKEYSIVDTQILNTNRILVEYNSDNIINMLETVNKIVNELTTNISHIKKGTQKCLDVNYGMSSIMIVPKYKNKVIKGLSWNISTNSLIYNYDKFNMNVWIIDIAEDKYNQYFESVEFIEASFIKDFKIVDIIFRYLKEIYAIDEIDLLGTSMVKSYLQGSLKEVIELKFGSFIKQVINMTDVFYKKHNDVSLYNEEELFILDKFNNIANFISKVKEDLTITEEFIEEFEKMKDDITLVGLLMIDDV